MITFGISHQKFQHIQIIAKLAANQERKNATYKDKLSALSRDLDNVLNNLEPGSSNQNEDSGASRQMNKIENAIQTTTFEAESSISKYDWTIMTIKKLFIVKLLELTKLLHENISSNQGQEVENYVSNYYISPLTKKRNQEKEMIELLNKLNAELIRISIVDEHQTRELKVFNKQELRNRKELCESYQLDSKGENRKDLIIVRIIL